ncbi:uncharacterized protein [Ambystoma mexicanum]|uniref:uncharacterized protein isoform X1 n=1 Tax=Ambystoma mexicanum TaxID=8296 RepID=UPI0037E92A00
MSAKGPSLVPVTFHDVAVYFSEEEWEFLEDWQKDLYSSVMHEIHGVLISMGYAIVNPDTLFRIKKEEKPYISDHTPCKKRESFHDHASGSPVLCPDLLLRIKQEDEPVLYQPPGLKKRECILNPAPHHSTETSVISIRVKEEENDYMSGTQHSERTEHFSKPTSVPVVTSVFSLNKPADSSYSGGRQDLGKGFLEIPPGKRSDCPAIRRARLRNLKFNLEELEILIDEVVWHYDRLFGSQSTKTPISEKCVIWEAILERINGVGRCTRNIEMLKKRWNDFKRKTKEKIISNRALGRMSSTHQKLSTLEKKVATILRPEKINKLVLLPEHLESVALHPSHVEQLSLGVHAFKSTVGNSVSQQHCAVTNSTTTFLHPEQVEQFTVSCAPGRTTSGISKHERHSDMQRKFTTVLQSEQIEGLLEGLASSSVVSTAQHKLPAVEQHVEAVFQSDQIHFQDGCDIPRTVKEPPSECRLSDLKKQVENILITEDIGGEMKCLTHMSTNVGLSAKRTISGLEEHVSHIKALKLVLNQGQDDLAETMRASTPKEWPSTQHNHPKIQKCIDTVQRSVQRSEHMEELLGRLDTSRTGSGPSTQQHCSIELKKDSKTLQLERMEKLDRPPSQKQGLNLQPEHTDGFKSSGSESACQGTSSLYNEEEGVAQAETEVEDAPEVSPREEQEHTAERTEMQSGPMAGPHQSEEQTGKEDMGKENQYPSVENTNKEATAKEAQPFTTEQHGKETTPNKVQTRVQRKKRNDGGIKEPTFAFMIKPKSQPHQNTTPLKAEENLRRETDLPNGDAGAGSQHLLRNILPLVEKLDTFVDLQNKQYETLKCSVRQINVHLRHQTRTLVKINTSIQKQTSAINRLARAQRASASNIETLAANVLRTNASLVEGNALLNKTLQGGLDMLQVIIKAHWQPHCSATAESSMAASPQLDPKTLEMTSLLRQTTGIRRLRRSPSGDRSSTHRKLRKRPINPSVAISPL